MWAGPSSWCFVSNNSPPFIVESASESMWDHGLGSSHFVMEMHYIPGHVQVQVQIAVSDILQVRDRHWGRRTRSKMPHTLIAVVFTDPSVASKDSGHRANLCVTCRHPPLPIQITACKAGPAFNSEAQDLPGLKKLTLSVPVPFQLPVPASLLFPSLSFHIPNKRRLGRRS